MTDEFIAMFLQRSTMGIVIRPRRIGLFRSRDDVEPLRPQLRMAREEREWLQLLEGPSSWLCECLDAFPKFLTDA